MGYLWKGCATWDARLDIFLRVSYGDIDESIGFLAEEGGGGKVILLERGAYDGMDICLMFVLFV